jgi:hypothetical protein
MSENKDESETSEQSEKNECKEISDSILHA